MLARPAADRRQTILAMPDANILAHTTRALQVAIELRKLGYAVEFASDGKYVSLIEGAGFSCRPHLTLDPDVLFEVCRRGRTNFFSREFLARCIEADCRLFEKIRPDLILSDFRCSVSSSAEILKIPQAVILNALWTNHFSAPLSAPEGTIYEKIFGRALVSRFPSALVRTIKQWTLQHDARVHNQVRRAWGLPARANLFELMAGDLNLIADLPEYGPTAGLPGNFVYVGPIVWEPDCPVPDWLDALDRERPTLYVSAGSSGNPAMFRQVIGAFADTPYQCLLTTAGLVEIEDPPPNVHIATFAPGAALMRCSDAVICQGGNGTVYQALRAGVPIIGFPTMHDQHFNMDQVLRLRMGQRLSLSPFRAGALRQVVDETVAQKREYQERAAELNGSFARYPGASAAASAIDHFLNQGLPA